MSCADDLPMFKNQKCVKQESKKFMIEEKTSLGSDPCYQKTADEQSVGVGGYNLNNHYNCGCGAQSTEEVAMEQPSVIFRDGYGAGGMDGCKIDTDSLMKNGTIMTNPGCRQQLFSRPYLTVPYMGRGSGDSCVESPLQTGEDTFQRRECNTLSEVTLHNQFTPLLPCLKDNIQDARHLIQEDSKKDWVRGGLPSRQIVKNKDYQQYCA